MTIAPKLPCIKCGSPRDYRSKHSLCMSCYREALPETNAERFWSHVDKTGRCWLWMGAKNTAGYGVFRLSKPRRMLLAHRTAIWLTYGYLPDDLFVCHHCDNPQCVRPDHLFLGTTTDNQHDMIAKGRAKIRKVYADAIIACIKRDVLDGVPPLTISKRYGVRRHYVYAIKGGCIRGDISPAERASVPSPATAKENIREHKA